MIKAIEEGVVAEQEEVVAEQEGKKEGEAEMAEKIETVEASKSIEMNKMMTTMVDEEKSI